MTFLCDDHGLRYLIIKAAIHKCCAEQLLWEISQNSKQNSHDGVCACSLSVNYKSTLPRIFSANFLKFLITIKGTVMQST